MKTRNLFLSLFAFAAICACNKEAQQEVPAVLEKDAYVAVSIVAPSSVSTRADGGFEAGTGVENTMNNAMFIFYDASGDYVDHVTPTLKYNDNVTNTSPFVEKVSEAIVILKKETITPTQMLVVLNYPGGFNPNQSLSDIQSLSGDYSSETSFVMSNSVYAAGLVAPSQITSNIKNTAAEAIASPVTVYVERVLAKVTVDDSGLILKNHDGTDVGPLASSSVKLYLDGGVDTDGDGDATNNTLEYDVRPVALGYQVTNRANQSYLYKNANGWDIGSWVYDDDNFRSYWATSSATSFTKYSHSGIDALTKSFYCQENTTSTLADKTSLIIAAQIQKTDGNPVEFYKYGGDYYSEAGIKALAVKYLKDNNLYKNTNENFVTNDIVITPSLSKSYEVVLTVSAGTDVEKTNANTSLADAGYDKVWMWDEGKAYYYTNINHFGQDNSSKDLIGVVRNHVYKLSLDSIKGFGIPVVTEDTEITPETPTDKEYQNLAATIKILQWKVVTQNVDLE